MQEYKREKNTVESQLKEMRKRARYHDDHLRAIDSWFKQLIDEVKVMAEGDDDEDMQLSSLPSSLLFAEQAQFEDHLTSRSKDIRAIISRLFGRTRSFTPDVVQLQKRISQLLAAEKDHAAQLERVQEEKDDLEGRLENASLRYMVAEKKIDRAKSTTVAKLEKQALLGGAKAISEESGAVKKEEPTTNGVTDNSEELAELEGQNNKLTAAAEKQKEQLEKLQEENAKHLTQITELTTKSSTLTDDDYAKTELFKQLKVQHDDVVKRLNDLEAKSTTLKDENQKLNSERTIFRNQLDAETRAVTAEKDQQVGFCEGTLTRIRAERDNLLADQSIKSATINQDREAINKIQELNSALEDRVKALESENERSNLQNTMAVDNAELDSLSMEDLRSRYEALDQKYNLLNGELSSMSSAFQKSSKLASQKVTDLNALEEKVQRLSAEKAKADQKYFAAMKSKETREGEIRTLRMQNSKSSEVMAQMKDSEASARSLIANLEKQIAEIKEANANKTTEHRTAQQQKSIQDLELTRLTNQTNELRQHLATKDTQLSTISTSCRTAEVEVAELQASLKDTRRNLETWKSKSGQSEQYEMLRQLAYCNVCKRRLKTTAIKTCGHTFCGDCVEERVASRSRKCPNCGKSFGSNDYMKITL